MTTSREQTRLLSLLSVAGPSGHEGSAAKVWGKMMQEFTSVRVDGVGNLYAAVGFRGSVPKDVPLVLTAHIDEIGFVVREIGENGMLRIAPLGSWDPRVLVAQRVWLYPTSVENAPIFGVVGSVPTHVQSETAEEERFTFKELWVDVGCRNGEEVDALGLNLGDVGVVAGLPQILHKTTVVGRALDNRVGCYIVQEVLRTLAQDEDCPPVVGVITTMEEFGCRGAQAVRSTCTAEKIIAVDGTFATDDDAAVHVESMSKDYGNVALGAGVVLHRAPVLSRVVEAELFAVATEYGLPYQVQVIAAESDTDADAFALAGSAAGLVSVPMRNLHTPCEMADLSDIAITVALLVEYCRRGRALPLL